MVEEIFSFIRTWDPNLFNEEFYIRAAEKLGWDGFPELVEREMIFYDTIYAFFMLRDAVFVGGSMVNRVYVTDAQRFSFDIDSVWSAKTTKRELLKEVLYLNSRFVEMGMYYDLLSGLLRLGEVQVDVAKDVFPDMLSLKRIMPARLVGTPLPLYVKTRLGLDPGRPDLSAALLGLKERLGYMPKVEEIRIEVGLTGFEGKRVEVDVSSLIEGCVKPRLRPAVRCSSLEASMSRKLKEMEVYDELKLPDLIRDLCDLRALSKLKAPLSEVNVKSVLRTIERVRAEGKEIYEGSWHFQLVRERYTLDELCSEVEGILVRYLKTHRVKAG